MNSLLTSVIINHLLLYVAIMSRCVFLPVSTYKIVHSFSKFKSTLTSIIGDSTRLFFIRRPRNKRSGPTCLVLSPTRELAQQIEMEVKKFSYRGIRRFLLLFLLLWIWLIILSLISKILVEWTYWMNDTYMTA